MPLNEDKIELFKLAIDVIRVSGHNGHGDSNHIIGFVKKLMPEIEKIVKE